VRESVRGREALLRAAPGLVEELGFLMPVARGASLGRASLGRIMLEGGLTAYDLLARRRTHRRLRGGELELLAPRARATDLAAAFRYGDAWTDDARLVLRVALDAAAAGAVLLTYAEVEGLLLGTDGAVLGVRVADRAPERAQGGRGPCDGRVTPRRLGDRLRAPVAEGAAAAASGEPLLSRLAPSWPGRELSAPADGRPVFAILGGSVDARRDDDVDHPDDLDAGPGSRAGGRLPAGLGAPRVPRSTGGEDVTPRSPASGRSSGPQGRPSPNRATSCWEEPAW